MFINTVQTESNFKTGKTHYDSRIPKTEEPKIETILIDKEKLQNVITLYTHNMPILCLITLDDETIEGIPTNIENNELDLLVKNSHIKINLSKIRDFKILEI